MNLLLAEDLSSYLACFFASTASQEILSWKIFHVGEIYSWLQFTMYCLLKFPRVIFVFSMKMREGTQFFSVFWWILCSFASTEEIKGIYKRFTKSARFLISQHNVLASDCMHHDRTFYYQKSLFPFQLLNRFKMICQS